jgi:hypothetical protein
MSSYWSVVTGWNDDQGQRKRQMEYWIDASAFSVEEVLKAMDQEKAGILQPIQTFDVPGSSSTEKIRHLSSHHPERLLRGVMLSLVRPVPNDPRFVDFDVAETNVSPPENSRQLVEQKYGVTLWRLNSAVPVH